MTLCLENQKKSGVCDRKDFGRVEASLYLQKLALVAAQSCESTENPLLALVAA